MQGRRTRSARRGGVGRLCLQRAWHKRCPQCGQGELFEGWARLRERCGVCGLVYRREPGSELGSVTLSTVVNTALAGLLFLSIWALTDWGPWLGLGVSAPLMIAVSYGLLPASMSVWVAIEYLTDVANREWWARPRR
jgi:uncharacterized protein (DUF983 family)